MHCQNPRVIHPGAAQDVAPVDNWSSLGAGISQRASQEVVSLAFDSVIEDEVVQPKLDVLIHREDKVQGDNFRGIKQRAAEKRALVPISPLE
jgi:hypothetical protein